MVPCVLPGPGPTHCQGQYPGWLQCPLAQVEPAITDRALSPRLPLLSRICGRCGRRKGPCSEVHFLHGLLPCREVCDGPSVSVSTKWVKSWFDQGAVILQGRAISKMTPSRLTHPLALPGGCWCTASPRYYQDWPRQSLGAPERGRPCCSSRVGSLPLMALRSGQFPQGHDTHQGKHA